MVESNAGKVVWSIKKADFFNGKFDEAKYELGNYTWSLKSNNKKPLQGDTVSLQLSFAYDKLKLRSAICSNFQASGVICLEELAGRYSVMKAWDWPNKQEVQLKVDNSILSFDDKYLFSDGTYRIGFSVSQDISFVDFASPDHSLILGPSDAGCLEIEDEKLYVSKSYFSAQSPYFKALFFGDFAEKNQEVIVLKDVKFYYFYFFLVHLYTEFLCDFKMRSSGLILDLSSAVLALADMFLCNTVTKSCEMMLADKTSFTLADLELADKYRLCFLRSKVIAKLSTVDLKKYLPQIDDSLESLYTRHSILDRIEDEADR